MNLLRAVLLALCLTPLAGARPPSHAPWTPANYLVYYGEWDASTVQKALGFELVILQPNAISRQLLQQLRAGRDGQIGTADDVKVLCYVSLGEDETPPRGLAPGGLPGPMHKTATGLVGDQNDFPTYYLDEVKLVLGPDGFFKAGAEGGRVTVAGQDGLPDENGVWGSFYTSAGDAGWRAIIQERTRKVQENLGADGFFLDTLDTSTRWGTYPWMEKDMVALVQHVREWNPNAILVANRGLSLFYDDGPAMRAALDGVMYESFVTDWDWERQIGIEHPVLKDQVEVLQDPVLKNATAADGFFLLFLNYRDPNQPDFVSFLHREKEILKDVAGPTYWTTPDLMKIDPDPRSYFPAEGPAVSALESVQAERTPAGAVRLTAKAAGLGKDTFLDLLMGPMPTALAHRLSFVVPPGTSGEVALDLWGVRDAQIWARLLGKSASGVGDYQSVMVPGPALPLVDGLEAHPMDGKIRLNWKGVPGGVWEVYAGPSPTSLKKVAQVTKPFAIVPGLVNDKAWAFSVAQIKGGKQVALSEIIFGAPRDKTPPPVPGSVTVEGNVVRWSAVSAKDLQGYRVYVWPVGKGLRLPLLADAETTTVEVENALAGQKYNVFVTAIDESGNESRPAPKAVLGP